MTMTIQDKKVLIRTFGCQMNEHDSERIAGLLDPGLFRNEGIRINE